MLYLDATSHRIGKNSALGHSLSAGTWAAWAMIPPLAGLFVIAYLVNRPAMIRRARQYPVTVPRTRRVATFFLLLAASLGCHWLLYYADIYPHYDSQFYQRHGIEDDTPRPIGDDG